MKKMKFLFFGAGVLASLYAAKLHEAGTDVTLVARGSRYEDLKKHGIVLEQFNTKEQTSSRVRLVDRVPEDEYFDLCLVLIQKKQHHNALPALAKKPHIPSFLFMNNDAEGPQSMIDALGRERVLLGHVNAGGERHTRNARDEMMQLRDEFGKLKEKSGIKTPVLDELETFIDPSVPPAFTA